MLKKTFLFASAAVLALAMSSCGSGYDAKLCEKLIDKADDDNLKNEDYIEMIAQLDALYDDMASQYKSIAEIESKTERCDKYDDLKSSDEIENLGKLMSILSRAEYNDELKGEAKTKYKEVSKKIEKSEKEMSKLEKKFSKCR